MRSHPGCTWLDTDAFEAETNVPASAGVQAEFRQKAEIVLDELFEASRRASDSGETGIDSLRIQEKMSTKEHEHFDSVFASSVDHRHRIAFGP